MHPFILTLHLSVTSSDILGTLPVPAEPCHCLTSGALQPMFQAAVPNHLPWWTPSMKQAQRLPMLRGSKLLALFSGSFLRAPTRLGLLTDPGTYVLLYQIRTLHMCLNVPHPFPKSQPHVKWCDLLGAPSGFMLGVHVCLCPQSLLGFCFF